MLLLMVFAMNMLSAQERTITGIVVDGSMGDDPLPGATISVVRGPNKKVSHGTVTDYEGKFTLKVDAQDKSFSVRFMGFETKDVNIEPGKNDYKVVLESDAKQIGLQILHAWDVGAIHRDSHRHHHQEGTCGSTGHQLLGQDDLHA